MFLRRLYKDFKYVNSFGTGLTDLERQTRERYENIPGAIDLLDNIEALEKKREGVYKERKKEYDKAEKENRAPDKTKTDRLLADYNTKDGQITNMYTKLNSLVQTTPRIKPTAVIQEEYTPSKGGLSPELQAELLQIKQNAVKRARDDYEKQERIRKAESDRYSAESELRVQKRIEEQATNKKLATERQEQLNAKARQQEIRRLKLEDDAKAEALAKEDARRSRSNNEDLPHLEDVVSPERVRENARFQRQRRQDAERAAELKRQEADRIKVTGLINKFKQRQNARKMIQSLREGVPGLISESRIAAAQLEKVQSQILDQEIEIGTLPVFEVPDTSLDTEFKKILEDQNNILADAETAFNEVKYASRLSIRTKVGILNKFLRTQNEFGRTIQKAEEISIAFIKSKLETLEVLVERSDKNKNLINTKYYSYGGGNIIQIADEVKLIQARILEFYKKELEYYTNDETFNGENTLIRDEDNANNEGFVKEVEKVQLKQNIATSEREIWQKDVEIQKMKKQLEEVDKKNIELLSRQNEIKNKNDELIKNLKDTIDLRSGELEVNKTTMNKTLADMEKILFENNDIIKQIKDKAINSGAQITNLQNYTTELKTIIENLETGRDIEFKSLSNKIKTDKSVIEKLQKFIPDTGLLKNFEILEQKLKTLTGNYDEIKRRGNILKKNREYIISEKNKLLNESDKIDRSIVKFEPKIIELSSEIKKTNRCPSANIIREGDKFNNKDCTFYQDNRTEYKKLLFQLHPDKNKECPESANKKFTEFQQFYNTCKIPVAPAPKPTPPKTTTQVKPTAPAPPKPTAPMSRNKKIAAGLTAAALIAAASGAYLNKQKAKRVPNRKGKRIPKQKSKRKSKRAPKRKSVKKNN